MLQLSRCFGFAKATLSRIDIFDARAVANKERIGLLCVILCIALGIANIFHVNIVIMFAIFAM